jgi:hypothetical protein
MAGPTKLLVIAASAFVLGALAPGAMADAFFVPLDGSDGSVRPADFGYAIDVSRGNRRVVIRIVLTGDAAKSFGRGCLTLAREGVPVVETTLGLADGGAKRGLLKITLDPKVITDGELVIWSGEVEGQPSLPNFGGFRLSVKTLLDRAKE